jgi:chaperonin GroEL (HSP60 family)
LLSGASLLSDWRLDQDPEHLPKAFGFLSSISIDERTGFIRLERHPDVGAVAISALAASADRSWPVSTVVIAVPDRVAYDELVEAINMALKVLSQLLEDPEVVAGAGCSEMHLAAWLELQASQLVSEAPVNGVNSNAQTRTLRQLRTCVRTFASLLKRVVGILCQEQASSALGSTSECLADFGQMVEQMERYNRPRHGWEYALHDVNGQRTLFGWDSSLDQVDDVLVYEYLDHEKTVSKAKVLDSLQCKREAITHAVECTLVLMRIGSVVKVQ